MFDSGMIWLLIIMVLVLAVMVFLFRGKKNQIKTISKRQNKRYFTEEDRQAVLLIRELGDIINDVKKAVK